MISFDEGSVRFIYRIVGVAIDHERVLLQRAKQDSFWALPGGRGELMEQAADTLRREMTEEIDTEVTVERLLWVVENFFEFDNRSFHELALYFLMSLPAGCPLLGQERFDGIEQHIRLIFEWHTLKELPDLPLFPSFLRTALQSLPATTQHVVHVDTQ